MLRKMMGAVPKFINQRSFRYALARTVALPLLLLSVLVVIFLWQLDSLLRAAQWVAHTDLVIAQAHVIQELMIEQETGLRGYLITGSPAFLEPYARAERAMDAAFDRISQLVSDNPEQLDLIAALRNDYAAWNTFADTVLTLRESDGDYESLNVQTQGQQQMDTMRNQIQTFIATEEQLRDTRSETSQRTTRLVTITSIAGALVLGVLLAIFTGQQLIGLAQHYEHALAATKAREDELYLQQEWFRSTLTSIGDGVIVTNDKGRIAFMNGVAQRMTGWSDEAAREQPIAEVFPILDEHTRAPAESPVSRALAHGVVVEVDDHSILTRQDGSEIPIDDSAAPIRDARGVITGAVLVFRDISQRKEAERALRASEEQFRQLAEAIPQLVWITTPDGYHEYFNQRWYDYTGTTLEQTRGEGWSHLLHPDDYQRTLDTWQHSLRTGELYEIEYRFKEAKTGKYRWFLGRAHPIRDDSRTITRWFGTCTDIDDQKRAEATLREQAEELTYTTALLEERNRELDQFAYVTSHDLKAPLRGIANLSQWIEEDLGEHVTDDIRKQLELLRGRVHRMEGLIDGILQYSRIGRVQGAIEHVDVDELLNDVIDLLAPPPGFTITINPQMPTLTTERVLLQQVFANLIGNAIKHHHRSEGQIRVSVKSNHTHFVFSVADDGPGIAPQYQERIFGMFQTLAPRDKVEGSGLGLSLVKKMIERQGGRIWIESEEGKGSTFFFTWPKSVQAASNETDPSIIGRQTTRDPRHTITKR